MNEPVTVAPAMLLRCLGQFRLVDHAGSDLTPRGRKARALFACLALSEHPVSRERLADLLWSDRGAEQARSSCRQAIFELRHLANGDAAVTVTVRDNLSLNAALISMDLQAIRAASAADDHLALEGLLAEAESGLLCDLDGLDPEFDAWLRVQRAHEPTRTFAAALASAERCLETDGPSGAVRIVSQLQRLDPCNEEAARLAMRLADRIGDRGSLHRHFNVLRERLQSDYSAAPSRETTDLFRSLAGQGALIGAEAPRTAPEPPVSAPARAGGRRWPVLAAVLLALIVAIAVSTQRTPPAAPVAQPLVAVFPFDQQGDTSGALAEGLWDDTRLALSQSRAVRVLGRTSSMALDARPDSPQVLNRNLGVDYLLEGGVRSQGERVRIVVSLTRARDGVSVWEQSFEGRLGDAMALQGAVAQAIEGRIRGRLAPGGGVHARQIVTTPQVYALYSEARALIRQRGQGQIEAASEKLQQAVRLDPNYAPAWASLASTARINRQRPNGLAKAQADAVASARHAIDLAPNLAHGFAALALAQGELHPASERLLLRAVELDPGNSEAWNWLGNSYASRGLSAQARSAWERSFAIDPLFASPFDNLLNYELGRGRISVAKILVSRLRQASADRTMIVSAESDILVASGDYSNAATLLSQYRNVSVAQQNALRGRLGSVLLRLGHTDEAGDLWRQSSWFGPVVRGEQLPPLVMDGFAIGPRDFWLTPKFTAFASRALILQKRPDLLVHYYRTGFRSRADFLSALGAVGTLTVAGPYLVAALRQGGDKNEAEAILAAIEPRLRRDLAADLANRTLYWPLARVSAQRGAQREAVDLLVKAHRLGWKPDGIVEPLDIAREPAFVTITGDPRFEAIRRQNLGHIARERRELGSIKL